MTLVRWDPFREIAALSDRLNRVLTDNPAFARGSDTYGTWVPPVDIFERDDQLILRAELAGLNRDDIELSIENGVLTLHGERRREEGFDADNAHRLERIFGSFTRSFTLPTTIDAARIAATYKDGILEIVLPKSEISKPKKVQIQAA